MTEVEVSQFHNSRLVRSWQVSRCAIPSVFPIRKKRRQRDPYNLKRRGRMRQRTFETAPNEHHKNCDDSSSVGNLGKQAQWQKSAFLNKYLQETPKQVPKHRDEAEIYQYSNEKRTVSRIYVVCRQHRWVSGFSGWRSGRDSLSIGLSQVRLWQDQQLNRDMG